ncbi:hypothetical protein AB205_0059980 [Aquarana catesbeiana]|uniref:Uncharacterized protein n=1 Tax=Aquarana catesbeiana TaxID=8400 RepID=A0A2G9PVP5_AQUCT|nr:hypothetical protein AB205_0059980 [Aquarana catesbeiana]
MFLIAAISGLEKRLHLAGPLLPSSSPATPTFLFFTTFIFFFYFLTMSHECVASIIILSTYKSAPSIFPSFPTPLNATKLYFGMPDNAHSLKRNFSHFFHLSIY